MEPDASETDRMVAGNLRVLREGSGLSQAEVARRMRDYGHRWHQTTAGRIEGAVQPLGLAEAVHLAGILGVPLERLITPGEEAEDFRAAAEAHDSLRIAWAETVKAVRRLGAACDAAREAVPAARSSRHQRAREAGDAIETALGECTLKSALREAGES